jgi:hypothetical protein
VNLMHRGEVHIWETVKISLRCSTYLRTKWVYTEAGAVCQPHSNQGEPVSYPIMKRACPRVG